MAKSVLHTGPSLVFKVADEDGANERIFAYASNLTITVSQGQKPIYGIDSPFIQELAQGAGPSSVRGSLQIFLPKGSAPEHLGLVPFRQDSGKAAYMSGSRYINMRLYDRATGQLVLSVDSAKISGYTMATSAKSVVQISLNFEGIYLTPGDRI